MLSKNDFLKEFGKSINIYPLDPKNIKENSINLTASKYAWSLGSGKYGKISIKKGETAVHNGTIILLPHITTVIAVNELISVDGTIGGTVHSKVGIAMKGIGHIGTMLGPNYHGRFLVPLHNITDNVITINPGDSFVSVIFYKLKTKYLPDNPTATAHIDKFSVFGIKLNDDEDKILNSDDEKNKKLIKTQMIKSQEYKNLKKENKFKLKEHLTKSNICKTIFLLLFFLGIIFLGFILDDKIGEVEHPWLLCSVTFILTALFLPWIHNILKNFD